MHDRTSKLSGLACGAILATTLLICGGTTGTLAQNGGPPDEIGAVVSITGSGGAVGAFGARVSVDGANARVKAAGAVVDVRGQIEGPVWAAGADVNVDATAGDSVRAAGARVAVRGSAAGDIMVAGALVDVDATAGGDMKAAGANVRLGPLTDIGGTLSAAGASVTFDGHVSGETKLAGAAVTFNGRADGGVSVHAERLVVGPRAVVAGNLFVRSLSEPQIDPGAQITGEVIVEQPGDWFDNVPEASAPVVAAVFALSIFVVGLVFLIFARSTYGEAVDHVRFRPLSTVLYGIVSLLVLVALAALLMATIVGFALGAALLLLLPMIFVLSQPVAAAGIVGWILGRTVPRLEVPRLILFLIAGALVIAFAGIIPFTGPWIVAVTLIFGLGGVLRAVLWRFRTARTSDQRFGTAPEREAVGSESTEL
jgi:cytoskeletal protein CcmA (bactofilin family)